MGTNLGVGLAFGIPLKDQLFLELDANMGFYNFNSSKKPIIYKENSYEANFEYNDYMRNIKIGLKGYLLATPHKINPYVKMQCGANKLKSKFTIDDPINDENRKIMKSVLYKSTDFIIGGEIGLEWDLDFKLDYLENVGHPDFREVIFLSIGGFSTTHPTNYINSKYLNTLSSAPGGIMEVTNKYNSDIDLLEVYRTPLTFVTVSFGVLIYGF